MNKDQQHITRMGEKYITQYNTVGKRNKKADQAAGEFLIFFKSLDGLKWNGTVVVEDSSGDGWWSRLKSSKNRKKDKK